MTENKDDEFYNPWDDVESTAEKFTESKEVRERENVSLDDFKEDISERDFARQYLVEQEQNPTVFGKQVRNAKRKMIKKAGFKKYGQLLRGRLNKKKNS